MDILLIFLISCFSYSNWFLGKSMLDRPLITGTIVGLAFGDLASGCIIGATIELALMGAQGIGAAAPPDVISGGILGTAFAIISHLIITRREHHPFRGLRIGAHAVCVSRVSR